MAARQQIELDVSVAFDVNRLEDAAYMAVRNMPKPTSREWRSQVGTRVTQAIRDEAAAMAIERMHERVHAAQSG